MAILEKKQATAVLRAMKSLAGTGAELSIRFKEVHVSSRAESIYICDKSNLVTGRATEFFSNSSSFASSYGVAGGK